MAATTEDRSYEKSFHFPAVVPTDDITAAYDADAGVLTVTLSGSGRRPRPSVTGDAGRGRDPAN